jgi:outer membrane biosynthesis protein TonB
MRPARWLHRSLCTAILIGGVLLESGRTGLGAAPARPAQQPRITETDVTPQSRPLTFSQLLDEYLAMVQEMLKQETASVQESGLVEVKLTVRKDGSLTFSEIVVLEGPAGLRNEVLPLVNRLGPLPPPPINADMLDVSVLLPLRYPSPDLLDSIDHRP